MSLCVIPDDNGTLLYSSVEPCAGYLLISAQDLDSHLTAYEVALFIAGAVSLYGMAFIFKLGRQTMGLR
ncbi:MAG: hypothetical protein KA770_00455 [Shewanella sp.]|jgi:hypothetical protein|nr:hypothetical protein [Shewanella sp.]